MRPRRSQARLTASGLASMVAGGLILVASLPGNAGAAPEQVPTPSVSVFAASPSCSDEAPPGSNWTEFKVEPVIDGTYSDGTITVTLTVRDTADGPVFDWTSTLGVDAVMAKGGPAGTLYLYDPPAESTGDTGLHAPVNPTNNQYFGLSNVSFCYDEDQGTTTTSTTTTSTSTSTTVPETTTTTQDGSTTTTTGGATTTTPGESTSTTAAAVVSTTIVSGEGQLPRTGRMTGPMVGAGAVLLAGGAAMVGFARRSQHA